MDALIAAAAQALAAGKTLPPTQREAMSSAGLLVLNKAENLNEFMQAQIASPEERAMAELIKASVRQPK